MTANSLKYKYGKRSEAELATVNPMLVQVCRRALSYGQMDATVVQGVRGKAEQDRYFELGKSRVRWPDGKHNAEPPETKSDAVDIIPFVKGKGSWHFVHCAFWAGLMFAAAADLGVDIRWGGDWDMDHEPVTDQEFQDLAHFELV